MQLTPRQLEILRIIIEEYIETAQPVGSEMLDRKYNLGISPATIRNEMVQLVRMGYLKQPHISAGRTPTPKALKLYISHLMKQHELSVAEEVSVKERMWDTRNRLDDMLHEAARALADKTKCVGIVVTTEPRSYHAGYRYLLDEPEFYDIDVTKTVFGLLDESSRLWAVLEQANDETPIHVLLGDDFDNRFLQPIGIVFSDFNIGAVRGAIGVIGPSRLNFGYVFALVRHLGMTLEELSRE